MPFTDLIKFRVTGDVQGVGFRYFVQTAAYKRGLQGWVCNCSDGSVLGAAAGDPTMLAELKQDLQVGPPMSNVANVDIDETCGASPEQIKDAMKGGDSSPFEVRRTRR